MSRMVGGVTVVKGKEGIVPRKFPGGSLAYRTITKSKDGSPILLSIFETPEGKFEDITKADLWPKDADKIEEEGGPLASEGLPYAEVNYMLEGKVTFRTPEGDITAEAGDSLYLRPGSKWQYINSGKGKAVLLCAIIPPQE